MDFENEIKAEIEQEQKDVDAGKKKELVAGIGQYVLGNESSVLVCFGLGSCVSVVIFDKSKKNAAMAHVMLPSSTECPQGDLNQNKFADVVVPMIVNELINKGSKKENLVAKIAGGAQMFKKTHDLELFNIGNKNAEAIKNQLKSMNIPLIAEETGGYCGRTVKFFGDTTKFIVKTKTDMKEI